MGVPFAKPYRFQFYNSTKYQLHRTLRVHHPNTKSHSVPIFAPLPTPSALSLWLSPHYYLCLYVKCICFLANPFSFFHQTFSFAVSTIQCPTLTPIHGRLENSSCYLQNYYIIKENLAQDCVTNKPPCNKI